MDADPLLATRDHRPRLYVILALFMPKRSHQRVARALAYLRELALIGKVKSQAFGPDTPSTKPNRAACKILFDLLQSEGEYANESAPSRRDRLARFMRMFGHL
ncbi:hypothetical protein [Luteibacter sp. CQ10]|uniref:hypothetical protein n=1 Tax=Luteibacter sp. CQ10 TaxID=2805821 RepID=UPI0034A0DDF1